MTPINEALVAAERAAVAVLQEHGIRIEAVALHVVGIDVHDGGRFRYALGYTPQRLYLLGRPEGDKVADALADSLANTAESLRSPAALSDES